MKIHHIIISLALLLIVGSCHPGIEERDNTPQGNFDALWTIVDEHYCFFAEKNIDWEEVYSLYSQRVRPDMSSEELFIVCSEMLDELQDGHVNLSSPYATSYYRKWWSDYPQNFDSRVIEQYYFNFNYRSIGAYTYGFLSENVGYLRCSSFSTAVGDGNLDLILSFLSTAQGLIIDVRDNGGGDLTNAETLISHLITRRVLAGYISHKTGPGHDDFSEPFPYYYSPVGKGHVAWGKPIVILTNRSTFSAANNFVAVMKPQEGVTVMGATTGGGSGMPYNSEMPCGWSVRLSACSMLDAEGISTERGIDPTPGCAVDIDPSDLLSGRDSILDAAILYLQTLSKPDDQ